MVQVKNNTSFKSRVQAAAERRLAGSRWAGHGVVWLPGFALVGAATALSAHDLTANAQVITHQGTAYGLAPTAVSWSINPLNGAASVINNQGKTILLPSGSWAIQSPEGQTITQANPGTDVSGRLFIKIKAAEASEFPTTAEVAAVQAAAAAQAEAVAADAAAAAEAAGAAVGAGAGSDGEEGEEPAPNPLVDMLVAAGAIIVAAGAVVVGMIIALNKAPTITNNAVVTVNENEFFSGLQVVATDVDKDDISYKISGGDDGDLFIIDETTGRVFFRNAPDYEAPADADGDNVYNLEVEAWDTKFGIGKKAFTIFVEDVDETSGQTNQASQASQANTANTGRAAQLFATDTSVSLQLGEGHPATVSPTSTQTVVPEVVETPITQADADLLSF